MTLSTFLEQEEPLCHGMHMVKVKYSERIIGQFYSYNKGKSWSRYDPEVEAILAEVHRERELEYLYACYIYYHYREGDTGEIIESPLPDDYFDGLQNSLDLNRNSWSDYFKSKVGTIRKGYMKAEAFMITFTEEEKEAAKNWAREQNAKSKSSTDTSNKKVAI